MHWKNPSKTIQDSIMAQKRNYLLLLGLLIIGLILGGLFTLLLSKTDKQLIQTSLDSFFKGVMSDDLNYLEAFFQSIKNQVLPAIFMWILGISILGIPILLFYDFLKGFLIGFSFTSILMTYRLKGILKAIFYIFPHQILGAFLTVFLLFYAIRFSSKLFKVLFLKQEIDLKRAMKRYFQVLGISIIGFCFLSLMEVFLTPVLLKMISKI